METAGLPADLAPLPGAAPAWRAHLPAADLPALAQAVKDLGGRLVALWGADERDRSGDWALHAAFATDRGLLWASCAIGGAGRIPDITPQFLCAERMQRAVSDMLGIPLAEGAESRKWLRHGAWPPDAHPLRRDFDGRTPRAAQPDDYAFVKVEGEGVHEIPVGPVHAGIIEPGHFRFSVVGERVLRLEERLGYVHKGIEKLFQDRPLLDGARLCARVSGDSTVAYSWAYAMACESAAGVSPPARAVWLRALLLERERVMNHLGDLGYLGNDCGLAFGLAQFSCLKEDMLRTNADLFGHRYLMDRVVPGGVDCDVDAAAAAVLREEAKRLSRLVGELRVIYDEHPGLQDRLIGAGRVAPELAEKLGLTGLAGRASALAWDMRVQYPFAPYDALEVRMATHRNGDVAARVIVRFEEALESLRLMPLILDRLPAGPARVALPQPAAGAEGLGWVEGWRGEVLVGMSVGENGLLRRVHPHDPSWQNWPALEHAVIDNIVPDFPLINKSFNLSYSGHDL